MKTLRYMMIMVLMVSAGSVTVNAQTTNSDKKATKVAAVKHSIESKHYTFIADYAIPMRGGQKQLTSLYDLRITPDSVIAFLPYFGRAYFDVPYNPTEDGIKFATAKFGYQAVNKKHGGWEITINPKDVKNLERLILYVSPDGYASLSVTSVNRDFISFDGYLKQ
ncbi:MAG TPA: DUF4251 domain-containing protein [Mucilaginibacter sp.]|nr:DUF4251 domain-containing protein [Mucilaginibacter sp.]